MTKPETILRKLLCYCIKQHKVLWFYYESSTGNYWRKVDPYILAIKDKGKGNTFFTGFVYPSEEAQQKNNNDDQGHYLLKKIDMSRFEVLDETFNDLLLDYDNIFGDLRTIKIICRVAFNKTKV
jgi:hypothetical protein